MIRPETIEHVRQAADLPAIVGRYTSLRRSGRGFQALCQFHDDHDPSLSLWQGRDGCWRFRCFACGAAGDSIAFLQRTESVSFPEAVRYLGDLTGIDTGTSVEPNQARVREYEQQKQWRDKVRSFEEWRSEAFRHYGRQLDACEERLAFWSDIAKTAFEAGIEHEESSRWLGQLYDERQWLEYRMAVLHEGTRQDQLEIWNDEWIK